LCEASQGQLRRMVGVSQLANTVEREAICFRHKALAPEAISDSNEWGRVS